MLLALDIGNTNVVVGAFQGETLCATWRMTSDLRRMGDEYGAILHTLLPLKGVRLSQITEVVVCSVVPPLTPVFEELIHDTFNIKPLVVGAGTKTGIRISYDNPRDVGADRIVDAVAAHHLYSGPLVVVDFGTATVFDAITGSGEYLGGAIASGLQLSADVLYHNTSQLRRVDLLAPRTVIGKNTVGALQAGLVFGHVSMVEGMVHRFRRELGENSKAVATGGLADLIAAQTDIFHAVNPELTLIGLRMIHEMNL
jgi:type III pantothenate kinase